MTSIVTFNDVLGEDDLIPSARIIDFPLNAVAYVMKLSESMVNV